MKKIINLLLILGCISVICGCNKVQNIPEATSKPNIDEVTQNIPEKEPIKIPEELESYAKNSLAMTDESLKTAFADFDDDGIAELFQITDIYGEKNLHIYSLVNGEAQEIIELEENPILHGSVEKLEIRKGRDSNILYMTVYTADGLCYENSETVELDNKNGILVAKSIASYKCDTEAEQLKREKIGNVDDLDATQFSDYIDAHTLMYEADGQKMTEEVYYSVLEQFELEHEFVAKIK